MKNIGEGSYSHTLLPEYVTVGNFSSIAEDVYFHQPSDNHYCVVNKNCIYTNNWNQPDLGGIKIGNNVWIGRGVKILPGITIRDGVIIGAHTVVAKDVPAYSLFIGNPGRVRKYRFERGKIKKLLKIKWWKWGKAIVEERMKELEDIDSFIKKYE